MNSYLSAIRACAMISTSLLITACASVTPVTQATIAEEELRDADFDLLFATEFPVASKDEALARAADAQKAGDLDRALFFYVKALKFEPDDPNVLATIGALHQFQDNPELAVRAYTLALRTNPELVGALEGRGLILLAHDENERAREDLTQTVTLAPTAWRSHNGLGLLADRRGEHDIAIEHYTAALAINPSSGALYNNRGYSQLLAEQYPGAESDLVKSAQQFGYRPAWINLGVLHARQRKYEAAVAAFHEVLQESDALNRTAEAAMANQDLDVAQDLLERAIRLSPTYFPVAEDNLAQLKLMTRNEG